MRMAIPLDPSAQLAAWEPAPSDEAAAAMEDDVPLMVILKQREELRALRARVAQLEVEVAEMRLALAARGRA